jgi:hypothetical protein
MKHSDSFIIGNRALKENPQCAEKINVSDMIFDHLSGLPSRFSHASLDNILSKFLKELLGEANQVFDQFAQDEENRFVEAYQNQKITTESEEEMTYRLRKKFKFNLDRCRYCVSGPSDTNYKSLIRRACIDAEIIKEDDPQDRLMFVSDAEAMGYNIISRHDRAEFNCGYKYIVCDINHHFVNFALITVDATESTSSVEAIVSNVSDIQGWDTLEKRYRTYLQDYPPSDATVEGKLDSFRVDVKNVCYIIDFDSFN